MKNLSLRTRIYLSMLALILFSFILTGWVAINRFSQQNKDYHDSRLKRKERTVIETIHFLIDQNQKLDQPKAINDLLTDNVIDISNINQLDINFFTLEGDILVSSHTEYFDQGIFVFKMDQTILDSLYSGSERIVQEIEVDTLSILSTYRSIISKEENKPLAIINIPYFQTNDLIEKDLREFLKTLAQVYGLFFLFAALLAYFLSNYITKSLKTIGEKIQDVSFEKTNIPIEWKSDDEIGALVNEYNRMINELEISADKLARSERDAAWREMAKQVAHEIKNPLTPMKLNIQYLQKAIDEKPEDWKDKFHRSSKTLIEQIDSLSSIASAFSNFAQMPKSQMGKIDLKEVLENVTQLFSEHDEVEISLLSDQDDTFIVNADKDQMSRVFNNLLKNAIQAIPDDEEGKVRIQIIKKGFQIIVSVFDNGRGIPSEEFDKIFVPNFTTKSTGMGLGLAMVKSIMENHNGKVWFKSKLGEGSTFYISLPVIN